MAALAISLMSMTAHAQDMGKGHKGQPKQEDQAKKKEEQEKKQELEAAYKNALKNIPDANEKPDPWKAIR